ncbi:DNA replication complex GINS protein PSF1 [Nadsonia fulvescens var. elongata DSM 6958]|uniref:DNA replication complex GINS protein PSF1 n=1 Tax=Nadsonia fulvescens var. elongata DSM 6958 TaxID=857566 RepID=A0A1E3PHH6_9ASCO|nr:DNA replication complex GINS protein PSF1 [Nadsonia fulvescens var. elongata DSM 6958]
MYGDMAHKLIQDSRRTRNLDMVPLYQEELVRGVVREIRDLDRAAQQTLSHYEGQFRPSQDRMTSCSLFVQHLCMRRNKRCLMAYQRLRAERIAQMAWEGYDYADKTVNFNLNGPEQDYLKSYSDELVKYKSPWSDIDLTGSLDPPRDLFIDVRVLKDAGEIQTEYGVFNLTKNSQFFVRQADVQRLIQQGFLQKM